jgi:hypothetical protein
VMGGLTFCTLLTLVVIPVVYEIVDRKVLAADATPQPSTVKFGSPAAGEQELDRSSG